MMTIGTGRIRPWSLFLALAFCVLLFCAGAEASIGDNLPEFSQCVKVRCFLHCDHTVLENPSCKGASNEFEERREPN